MNAEEELRKDPETGDANSSNWFNKDYIQSKSLLNGHCLNDEQEEGNVCNKQLLKYHDKMQTKDPEHSL